MWHVVNYMPLGVDESSTWSEPPDAAMQSSSAFVHNVSAVCAEGALRSKWCMSGCN